MKALNKKGFTLAELLIVMAIVVVLASVAIPTFNKQLETSRETNDMEIIRNAYTEALSKAILDAADGKINGLLNDGTSGEADADTSGDVQWAGSGTYKVVIGNLVPPATFAQNASDTTGWKYVSNKLMDRIVPAVDTSKTYVSFKFEIASGGNVQLVADSGTTNVAITTG